MFIFRSIRVYMFQNHIFYKYKKKEIIQQQQQQNDHNNNNNEKIRTDTL